MISLVQRRIQAKDPGKMSVSGLNGSANQAGATRPSPTQVHHEPRRRSSQHAGYTNGSYLARTRRSGLGSRQLMFRVR